MTEDHGDQLAILRANVDQAVAMSDEVGRGITAFFASCYTNMLQHGFSTDDAYSVALELTKDWIAIGFGFGVGDDDQ